jgi:AraC-type transcriptional regulator N-terminus
MCPLENELIDAAVRLPRLAGAPHDQRILSPAVKREIHWRLLTGPQGGLGLSVSSLNRHFRAATAMSPLQYQKQIRLQQARLRLLANPADVAGTGHAERKPHPRLTGVR